MVKPSAPAVNTGEIVLSAIKKLTKNTGWTTRTIIKFIKIEYNLPTPNVGGRVSRALKRGVRLGLLQVEQGRYRLNDFSKLVRPISSRKIRFRQQQHRGGRQKQQERGRQKQQERARPRQKERALYIRSRSPSSLDRR